MLVQVGIVRDIGQNAFAQEGVLLDGMSANPNASAFKIMNPDNRLDG